MTKIKLDGYIHSPWNWAREKFGESHERWGYAYHEYDGFYFYFRDQSDATLFMLRWA